MIRNSNNEIIFDDYPNFTPNLSPSEIFQLGSFGGTYWREIHSSITSAHYKNMHKKYPKNWFKNILDEDLTKDYNNYDKKINKYKVKVGTTLEYWESKNWITKHDPYGYVQWYFNFYSGRRIKDVDEYQIKRWENTAGKNSRFRIRLMNMIIENNTTFDDYNISPKIRQTLQHWGYQLTKNDFDKYKSNQ